MNEIWKDIENYKGMYQVSNKGDVKSLKRFYKNHSKLKLVEEKILKTMKDSQGYLQVNVCKNGACLIIRIHRLVAETFIPNPENKRTVNHINGIKSDNSVNNLEWNTYSENIKHAFRIGLKTSKHLNKPVKQIKNGKTIHIFCSLHEADRHTGISHQNISRCCNGKRNQAGGFQWEFIEEGIETDEVHYG